MYRTVVWATDGSKGADAALVEAVQLCELSGARLVAVHCDQRLNGRAGGWAGHGDEDDRRLRIRRQVDALRSDGMDVDLVVRRSHHDAAELIATIADELAADVVVCGSRGLGALTGALLGSVAHGLLHVAPCPVFVVPEQAAARTEPRATPVEAGA